MEWNNSSLCRKLYGNWDLAYQMFKMWRDYEEEHAYSWICLQVYVSCMMKPKPLMLSESASKPASGLREFIVFMENI